MPKKSRGYNRSALLIITAICTLVFSGIIKLVDGTFPVKLLAFGGLATVLAIISLIMNYLHWRKHGDSEVISESQF